MENKKNKMGNKTLAYCIADWYDDFEFNELGLDKESFVKHIEQVLNNNDKTELESLKDYFAEQAKLNEYLPLLVLEELNKRMFN